ncbi:MAG: methyltransferase domain-containing protein [Paracoccaceae bacterium]
MTKDKHDGQLGAVYSARDTAEIASIYDSWADSYEGEMARAGYRHPSIGAALMARHLPIGAAPILDAGAGTGLLGEWLQILGYPVIEALDISQGMLKIARAKGVYSAFHCLALGGTLPFASGAYQGIISTGVFTTGHVGPEAIDELIRICRPGGVIVLTVKDMVWQAGFASRIGALIKARRLTLLEETPPYISMPGEAGTSPSRALALEVRP